jgi:transposase
VVARALEVSLSSVRNWRRTLKKHNHDLNSLVRKEGSAYTSKLTHEQKQQVKEILTGRTVNCQITTPHFFGHGLQGKYGYRNPFYSVPL